MQAFLPCGSLPVAVCMVCNGPPCITCVVAELLLLDHSCAVVRPGRRVRRQLHVVRSASQPQPARCSRQAVGEHDAHSPSPNRWQPNSQETRDKGGGQRLVLQGMQHPRPLALSCVPACRTPALHGSRPLPPSSATLHRERQPLGGSGPIPEWGAHTSAPRATGGPDGAAGFLGGCAQ